MKKAIFYISLLIFIYSAYILINFITYHSKNLNDYGSGFLFGKIILLVIFGFIIFKTNPHKSTKPKNE
jgi:hypothetical protein